MGYLVESSEAGMKLNMLALTATKKQLRPEKSIGHVHRQCPVCDCQELDYEFIVENYPVCVCRRCTLMFLNPQPEQSADSGPPSGFSDAKVYEIHSANAAARLDQLAQYGNFESGKLLLIGSDQVLEDESRKRGLDVSRVNASEFENSTTLDWPEHHFTSCIRFSSL